MANRAEHENLIGPQPAVPPSHDEVREQLERILASPAFEATVKMQRFLRFIVDMTLEGRAGELKGYTIGTEVYGRGPDFNPAEDTVVRIQAGRLRRALEVYYLTEGKGDPVRITIPKGTYVPEFLPFSASQSISTETLAERNGLPRASPSIAVLPFANLTGDPERDFFTAGFTEELTIELTHYEDFHVIGYRATPEFTERLEKIVSLQVPAARFLIEGSLRIAGEQLKVGVKLSDTQTRELLWADQYRRDLSSANLVALQESISEQIVERVAGEYGIIPSRLSQQSRQKAPKELSTYEAMLRCYYFHMVLSKEAFLDAFGSLQSANEKEPDHAMTLAMLADLHFTAYSLDLEGIEHPLEKGAELIERAAALETSNQYVIGNLARLHFLRNEREAFFAGIERTLRLNPRSGLRCGGIGFYLCLYGDWERGMALLEKAIRLSPNFPNWFYGPIVLWHYRREDYESAYNEAVNYMMPNNFWGPMLRAATLGMLNRSKEAERDVSALLSLRPDFCDRAGYLIRLYVKEEKLVGQILEGLMRVGLEGVTAREAQPQSSRPTETAG